LFHFTKDEDQVENSFTNSGPNFAVYGRSRKQQTSESEIEITDAKGKFYILESKQAIQDRGWDVLVGEESVNLLDEVEIKVKRIPNPKKPKDKSAYTYKFLKSKNPEHVTLSLSIDDKYIDVEEYRSYLKLLRYVSMLPLKNVPTFDKHAARNLRDRRRKAFFASHETEVVNLHTTPTFLGQFSAQAVVALSSRQLKKIKSASENDMWRAFALAYNLPVKDWAVKRNREGLLNQMKWFRAFFLYPLRLFNVRLIWADAIKDASAAIEGLMQLKVAKNPLEAKAAYYRIFDVDHPQYLTRALLTLTDKKDVPRLVSFTTKPKGRASSAVKRDFGMLNGKKYNSKGIFLLPSRYKRAMNKMGQFDLSQPSELRKRPVIKSISVDARRVPKKVLSKISKKKRKNRHVYINLSGRGLSSKSKAKIYIRVEQSGAITFGKLELAEKVLSLRPIETKNKSSLKYLSYGFYLTGPMSKLRNFVFDQIIKQGDRFRVTLAVSRSGSVWSEERSFEFRFANGKLSPIEE